jgi:peptidoglycan/xylan/chitin deacetylase (PgdA/CDA1 family)
VATPAAPAVQSAAAAAKPDRNLIRAPETPTETGGWWKFYAGTMAIAGNNFYDPHGVDFKWAYSRKDPLPKYPRVVVHMHGSGGGQGSMEVFGPSPLGDIEVRTQDAEAYNQDWREWWTFGRDGTPYAGRRIVATLQFLRKRYNLDLGVRGIVLQGPSMGGAGAVIQTMILPSPWREYIAWSSARAGVIMPRQIARRDPAQYANFPPDNAQHKALWDSIDFAVRSATDPTVQGIHYRHAFSTDDQFSAGVNNASTQLEFVNLIEQHRIGGAFGWVKAGHSTYEQGVNLPDLSEFEAPEQDVTLDRAHPAITRSTGNFPLRAADRANHIAYPRGHYNMGITWNHAGIVDDASQIVFPLKYKRRAGIGGGIPDQPERITISVTPRRAKHFRMRDGETVQWSWDGGALSGVATVAGGTVTIDAIPLQSGDQYKMLRIFHPN